MGESIRQEVVKQGANYLKRVSPDSNFCVELRRQNQKGIFCQECKNEEGHYCQECSTSGPIPVFVRKRTVTFHETNHPDWMTMTCSCLHNDGYPCRHMAALVRIHYKHFIPRYHRKFIHGFETKEGTQYTVYYKPKLTNFHFNVQTSEWKRLVESLAATEQVATEWNHPDVMILQRTANGVVEHPANWNQNTPMAKYSQAGFSQDVGLPEPSPWQTQTPMRDEDIIVQTSTGDMYLDNNAMLQQISQQCRQNKELERRLSVMFRDFWPQVMEEINKFFPSNTSGAENSQYLDLYGPYDSRKRDRRIKAGYERGNKKKKYDH